VDINKANKYLNQAKTAIEIKEFKKAILFASKAKMTAKKLQAKMQKTTTKNTIPEPESSAVDESLPTEETSTPEEVTNPDMTSPQ
jgi:hypothetical protein